MGYVFSRRRLPVILVLWLALALRLLWLHDVGYVDDMQGFTVPWMRAAAHEGAHQVYSRYDIVYPPSSIYLLGLIAAAASSPPSPGPITPAELAFLKVTTIAFELILTAALYRTGLAARGRRAGLIGAALYALCPPMVFITGWWGQLDAWFILFMFLAAWGMWRNRPLLAWALLGLSLTFKVQTAVMLPLMMLLTWRQNGWKQLALGMVVLVGVLILAVAPVWLRDPQTPLPARISQTARDFPYISAQGHNLWYALTPAGRGRGLDIHSDLNATPLGVSYRDVGLGLLAIGYSALLAVLFIRKDRRLVFLGAAMAWLLFFMLPTRIHARFLLPALPFFVAAGFFGRRWWWFYGVLSVTLLVNLLERAGSFSPWSGLIQITPGMSLLNAWINVGLFVLAWIWLIRSPVDDARPSAAWSRLSTWEKAFLALWAIALPVGIGLVWQRGYVAGKEVVEWSADLPATLAASLAETDPAHAVIINWPRAVAADARLFGVIPVTPPATFLPLPDNLVPDAMWVQYSPWQGEGPWRMTYHGTQTTEDELREAVAAAEVVLAFAPQEPAVYPLLRRESGAPDAPCPILFDDTVCLLDVTLDSAGAGGWRLGLTWRVPAPPTRDLTVFVHGLTADEQLIAQADGLPAGGLLSFDRLTDPAASFRETRFLPASELLDRLRIGLYDPMTGERAPVRCASGFTCTPDAVELVPGTLRNP